MSNTKHKALGFLFIFIISFGFFGYASAANTNNVNKQVKQNKAQNVQKGNIRGTITSIKGSTITVEVRENKVKSSKTIITDAKTRFGVKQIKVKGTDGKKDKINPVKATIADFKVGNKITINGKTNTNGTVTAKNIKHVLVKNKNK